MKVTNESRILLDASLIGGGTSDSDSGGEEGYVPGPDCCDDDPVDVAVDGNAYVPGTASTPAYVQSKSNSFDASGTNTVTLDSSPIAGNLLVAFVAIRDSVGATIGLTGWTLVRREYTGSGADDWPCAMFYRVVESGDPAAWTFTSTATTSRGMVLIELSGASSLDVDVGSSAVTTTPTISITPSAEPVILVSAVSLRDDSDQAFTPASGMTEIADIIIGSGTNGPQVAVNYQIVSAPSGAYTIGSTGGGSNYRAVIGASFRGGVAGYVVAPEVTDADDATYVQVDGGTDVVRIDLGSAQLINRSRLRIASENAGSRTYTIYGSNIGDFSTEALLSSVTFTALGSYSPQDVAFFWAAMTDYRYYRLEGTAENRRVHTWELVPPTLATDVDAVVADLAAHEADTVDAHDASAVSFTPAGTIAATNVQAAIEEVASEASSVAALDDLSDVTITAPADDDTLRRVSGEWINDNRRWEPVTTNPGGGPELVWDGDDIVMTWRAY